jgi:AraC-like DNA-binding protein
MQVDQKVQYNSIRMTPVKIFLKSYDPRGLGTAEFQSFVVPRPIGCFFHAQDFFEVMFVTEGEGQHWLNGKVYPLTAGQLCFVTPRDVHDIGLPDNKKLYLFNMNFSARIWQAYCDAAQIDIYQPCGISAENGFSVTVPASQREPCRLIFQQYLSLFQSSPSALTLCRFWSAFLPYMSIQTTEEIHSGVYPVWLFNAMRDMEDWQNLVGGLDRFIELTGVSVSHATRVLKATTGLTPSEYINDLRVKRAARLLATTPDSIVSVAIDSGFESLSYFHRLFMKHYGMTPRAYRMQVRK